MTPLDFLHSAKNVCYSGMNAAIPKVNTAIPFTCSLIAITTGAYVGTKCYPKEFKANDPFSITGMPQLAQKALQVAAIAIGILTTCLITARLNSLWVFS